MTELLRLPIEGEGGEASHLSVRLDAPVAGSTGPPAEESRAAPTVLYLHGFGSSQAGEKADFFRQRALEAGLGFCSFDFQGHGDSGGGMLGLTLSRNIADVTRVREMLRQRSSEPVVMMGSSMGGFTGLWYSALNPEEVDCGLYIAPALGMRQSLDHLVGRDAMRAWGESGRFRLVSEQGEWDVGYGLVEDLASYPPQRLRAEYRTPCLLLQGRKDDRVLWRRVVEFATRADCEGVELHLFADGDHRLVDRLERLWELMLGFLGDRQVLTRRPPPAVSDRAT